MREIKFRAWDTLNKVMISPENIEISFLPDECMIINGYDVHEDCEIIPLQFTGLKDKNGKEIYEGDIVYYNQGLSMGGVNSLGHYEQPRLMDGTRTVEWKDKGFDWEGQHSGLMFCKGGENQYEVIGNIYENPELIGIQK